MNSPTALHVLAKLADGHVLVHPPAQRVDGDGIDHACADPISDPEILGWRIICEISGVTAPQRPAARAARSSGAIRALDADYHFDTAARPDPTSPGRGQ